MTAMYQSHFGLAAAPFSIAPDPRYLYMSQRHQEALAHLLYGLGGDGGFVLLTGEVGAGKTTICRCLLEQIHESCDVAYIFNPKVTVGELLSTLCVEFGIEYPPGNTSVKVYIDCINRYLLDAHARGRSTVLIIDEAQNLSIAVLEQMRAEYREAADGKTQVMEPPQLRGTGVVLAHGHPAEDGCEGRVSPRPGPEAGTRVCPFTLTARYGVSPLSAHHSQMARTR